MELCPFCGGEGAFTNDPFRREVYCSCWSCGARAAVVKYIGENPTDEDIDQAKANWNERYDL